jgi:hypothetical protein
MTKEQAIEMAKSEWWKTLSAKEIVAFQLFEPLLCMDFSDFHAAIEKALDRPVFTHEFAFSNEPGGLKDEFLGKSPKKTFAEIMNLISKDKRVLIVID